MSYTPLPASSTLPSYADFYRTEYGQFIKLLKPIGRVKASLLEVEQPAGDWSDRATTDLILTQNVAGPAHIAMDVGAGHFSGVGKKHDFTLAPPGSATRVLIDAPHRIRILAIPWESMSAWAESDELRLPTGGDFGVLHQTLSNEPRLTQTLDALWRQEDGASAAGALFSDALLLQVIATLVELARPVRIRPAAGLTPRDLKQVDACMRARLAEDLGIADLAAETGLSVAHFCRAFKQSTGRSPYQALIHLRMQHAQQLLSSSAMSVAEVALECGYAQPAHFAKLFRREVGLAPAQWRRARAF